MPATHIAARTGRRTWHSATRRGAGYFVLWMVIAGGDAADVVPGILAAILATWVSLRLMPPDPIGGHVRWFQAIRLFVHFAGVSVLAGFDVARRALAPRMRLDPGYVHFRPLLPPSDARSLFQAMTSQMPGTIPSGSRSADTITYHCLDASQPVAEQLADEESRLLAALGGALGSAAAVSRHTRHDA